MRNLIILVTLLISLSGMLMQAQEFKKPSDGKSIVYFVRNSMNGAAMNIEYYDGKNLIGQMSGAKAHFIYECEPGKHLFMFGVTKERADYIFTELESDKVYIVLVRSSMGKLNPYFLDPSDKSDFKKAYKSIGARVPSQLTENQLQEKQEKYSYFISKSIAKYKDDLGKDKNHFQDVSSIAVPKDLYTNGNNELDFL